MKANFHKQIAWILISAILISFLPNPFFTANAGAFSASSSESDAITMTAFYYGHYDSSIPVSTITINSIEEYMLFDKMLGEDDGTRTAGKTFLQTTDLVFTDYIFEDDDDPSATSFSIRKRGETSREMASYESLPEDSTVSFSSKSNFTFHGIYDGGSHYFGGFANVIDDSAGSSNLFGDIASDGQIKNMKLINIYSYNKLRFYEGAYGILARRNEGTIENCSFDSSVIYTPTSPFCYTNKGIIRNCTITHCSVYATQVCLGLFAEDSYAVISNCHVKSSAIVNQNRAFSLGGICCHLMDQSSTVTNCFLDRYTSILDYGINCNIGGIVCTNNDAITGNDAVSPTAFSPAAIVSCVNAATIQLKTISALYPKYVGGIAAQWRDYNYDDDPEYRAIMRNCTNYGDIVCDKQNTSKKKNPNASGLVAHAPDILIIENCANYGNIQGTTAKSTDRTCTNALFLGAPDSIDTTSNLLMSIEKSSYNYTSEELKNSYLSDTDCSDGGFFASDAQLSGLETQNLLTEDEDSYAHVTTVCDALNNWVAAHNTDNKEDSYAFWKQSPDGYPVLDLSYDYDEPESSPAPLPTMAPKSTTTPVAATTAPTTQPSDSPTGVTTPEPSGSPAADTTPQPSNSPAVSATPQPSNSPAADTTPQPSGSPAGSTTPRPSASPAASLKPSSEHSATQAPSPAAPTGTRAPEVPATPSPSSTVAPLPSASSSTGTLPPATMETAAPAETAGSPVIPPAADPLATPASDQILPSRPEHFHAAALSNRKICLSWTGVAGVSGYQILRSRNSANGFTQIASVPALQSHFTDTTCRRGIRYYYRIISFCTDPSQTGGILYSPYSSGKATTYYFATPTLSLSKGATPNGTKYLSLVASHTKGDYMDIRIKKGNGAFVKHPLSRKRLSTYHGKLKLSYSWKKATLYVKVRTYRKKGRKRLYSNYSKTKKIRL